MQNGQTAKLLPLTCQHRSFAAVSKTDLQNQIPFSSSTTKASCKANKRLLVKYKTQLS